jgi:hypothetical protein
MPGSSHFSDPAVETRAISRTFASGRSRRRGRVQNRVQVGKFHRRRKPRNLHILELERRYPQHLVVYFVDRAPGRGFKEFGSPEAARGRGEAGGALWRRAFDRGP